jgi:copper chaperone CopZ
MVSPDVVDHFNRTGHSLNDTTAITHYLVGINGMSCLACANRLKQTFESSLAVADAKIFFQNNSAIVTLASSQGNHAKNIIELVHNLDNKYSATILASW